MNEQSLASSIPLGRFTLEPEARRILVDNEPARVGARAFDLLLTLVRHRGEVVGKQDLLESVWPGMIVEENNLQVQICALRKLLGPQTIVTVPGRGYTFAAAAGGGYETRARVDADPSPRALSGNIAAPMTPLRGRDGELHALAAMVRSHRLTNVAGPGGVGKTRLAQAAAAQVREQFDSGVWTVELSSLTPRASIAAAVARVLGFNIVERAGSAAQLAKALSGRALLLVLENCEHLLDNASELARALLEQAPHVHVVVTSQAPLKIRGEQLMRLSPLELPSRGDATEPWANASMALFADLVRALKPSARLGDQEAHDAAAICRHLDGLPLAIELAAAWVPVLGLAGVRRQLGKRFPQLTADMRERASRHRSLAASLARSWQLLNAREQAAMLALSKFKGRFTLPMASRALQSGASADWQVTELLGALVDKSMVMVTPGPRCAYRLMETTRLHIVERVADSRSRGAGASG